MCSVIRGGSAISIGSASIETVIHVGGVVMLGARDRHHLHSQVLSNLKGETAAGRKLLVEIIARRSSDNGSSRCSGRNSDSVPL